MLDSNDRGLLPLRQHRAIMSAVYELLEFGLTKESHRASSLYRQHPELNIHTTLLQVFS